MVSPVLCGAIRTESGKDAQAENGTLDLSGENTGGKGIEGGKKDRRGHPMGATQGLA
jgi:hypothetical protein